MNYAKRLQNVKALLYKYACDAFLIEDPIDIFYLTGIELSLGKVLISLQEALLIVDGRYAEVSQEQTLYFFRALESFSMREYLSQYAIKRLGFDASKISYKSFLDLHTSLENQVELLGIEDLLSSLRLIKDQEEIDLLKKAAHFTQEGYQLISCMLKEGISEEELAFALELFWKKRGVKAAFEPIIAFGSNTSKPHYKTGKSLLAKDLPVLVDIGGSFEGYCSDMTRVIHFGTHCAKIQEIYLIVEEAKEKAMALCFPGTHIKDLDIAARSHIASKGYGEYFCHSLGHGIGLEAHEIPRISAKSNFADQSLCAGMVITIEPGIYLPGIGGVRLEDTLLITDAGYENLTACL